MDEITFHHDTVLSDVHMHKPCTRHLMTHLNTTGQPVFMSRFRILAERPNKDDPGEGLGKEEKDGDPVEDKQDYCEKDKTSEGGKGNVEPCLDDDGDLNITHRPRNPSVDGDRDLVCPVILKQFSTEEEGNVDDEEALCSKDILRIEHTMATPLEDVGKQVWRGALLLADFILSKPDLFRESTVLELGAGTGLTSIVMTTTAKTVYCTDVGEDLLNLCRRNISLNEHLMKSCGKVEVRQLDWLRHGLCTDPDVEFSWTEEDIADLYDNTSFIIAADVCYDDDLTDGLFRTLHRLCSGFSHSCTVFMSIEKRFNFTLGHMDVSCDAYNHFKHRLFQLKDMEDGCCRFKVERVPLDFPQCLMYERVEQLELWQLRASPLSLEKAKSGAGPSSS